MKERLRQEVEGESFLFLREMGIFWESRRCLILSDLHAGKAAHFRKHGIPLSSDHLLQDLNIIDRLIRELKAERLMILGDLFHSTHNEENALVVEWLHGLSIPYLLVEGNHDVHSLAAYDLNCQAEWIEGPFLFLHEPAEDRELFQINGHVHPGFALHGKAKQSIRLPAFYMDKERLILPAFGRLNGLKTMKKKAGNRFILVGPQGLVPFDK